MSDNSGLTKPTRSLFSTVRLRARHLWKGPRSISWNVGEEPYFGWPVLLLQKTSARSDLIDTRAIFANFFDTSQENALLRATLWDGDLARRAVRDQGEKFQPVIPAKFVLLAEEQALSWMAEFDGIQFVSSSESDEANEEVIRRLRIEKDYKNNIFEMVWQTSAPGYDELNRKWDFVWGEFAEALSSGPSIQNFREDFWVSEPNFTYDLQSYSNESSNANEKM